MIGLEPITCCQSGALTTVSRESSDRRRSLLPGFTSEVNEKLQQ